MQYFCDYLDLSFQRLMRIVRENMNYTHDGIDKYLPRNV